MIAALNFKKFEKGSMRGFFDLRYHGLTIKGCRLMSTDDRLWIGLPQKEINQGGERKWVDQLYLTPPEMDHIRFRILAELESQGVFYQPTEKPTPKRGRTPEKEDLSEYYTKPGEGDDIPF